MTNFDRPYLDLLKQQVEDEISYLISVGHNVEHPFNPCIWCNEFQGVNICKRMRILREFHKDIRSRMSGNQEPRQSSLARKKIESELPNISEIRFDNVSEF